MMSDPNANQQSPENEENKEESLAERSARLEAEAAGGVYAAKDPLDMSIDTEQGSADDDTAAAAGAADISNAQLDALKAELDATKDQMMRVAADAENTKRRALKERDDVRKFAIQGFSRDLVNVADNLRRALEAVPDDLKEDVRVGNLMEGIEATERELLRSFEKNGIEKLNPKGEIFDPNFHEVMFEVPVPGQAAGTIIEVIETGYTLHGRILRPARVGVAKDDGQGGGQPETPQEPGSQIDTEA